MFTKIFFYNFGCSQARSKSLKKSFRYNVYFLLTENENRMKFIAGEPFSPVKNYRYRCKRLRDVPLFRPMKGNPDSGILGSFACGIRNREFFLLNPESWALESRVRLKGSGIPLTIGIRNPGCTAKKKRNQEPITRCEQLPY